MTAVQARSAEYLQSAAPGELRWPGHMSDDVGSTYGPEPLASLTATAETLVLSATRGTFRVPRSAVTKLGRGKMYPWFFKGLRIHHRVAGYPTDLQFQPLGIHWREVQAQLKALGYPVA
ncbi:MAG: hypothetical protein ACREH8_03130 [Opitutaceae bacterium]